MSRVWILGLLLFSLISGGVSAVPVYHGDYTVPFDRFVNFRVANATNPIVYHGVQRAYYQKVLKNPENGQYYMYYSDVNTTGITVLAVANSSDGDHFKFLRYVIHSGHPFVSYSSDGFGVNNKFMYWVWDEVSTGKQSPYKKSIRLYYSNNSDGTVMKDMGWVNFTWMMGTSNNGTISGTYGVNTLIYNASGNGLGDTQKDPFAYKYAIYFDCAGGSAENMCVVGSDDPLKFFRMSLHKVLMNDTPGAWDNLKLGYGEVVRFKGQFIVWYEGGKTSTREGTGRGYSVNGSSKFIKAGVGNPILKKDAAYLNKSVGGASMIIEGNLARLYVAGQNFSTGSYQVIQYFYDVKSDKNLTIDAAVNSSIKVYGKSGLMYTVNASASGDKFLLIDGLSYNMTFKTPVNGEVDMRGVNTTTAPSSIKIEVVNVTSSIPSMVDKSQAVASNITDIGVTTIYFKKTFEPNRVCSCSVWNTGVSSCDTTWVCNATSAYQFKQNSSHAWINVTHFSAYVLALAANTQMKIWDDTNDPEGQDIRHYVGQPVGFFSNFSNMSGHPINGTGVFCQMMDNSAGSMGNKENMTFNATSRLYYVYRAFGAIGTYNFNVTCNGTANGYGRLSAIDDFVISNYIVPTNSIQWGQVYWWTAEVIAHSLTYGVVNSTLACDYLNMYYVEPAPINGIEQKLNASADIFGNTCQNSTQGAFTINNDGTVGINISAKFNQITSGVKMKIGRTTDAWRQNCTATCDSISCGLTVDCIRLTTSDSQIAYNIPQNGSKQYWLWADFNGVAGTFAPTKGNLTTNATKGGG